jgi:hypothetical protein
MRSTRYPVATGALALLAFAASLSMTVAQIRLVGASDADWTVLTIAPNGAWGTATEGALNQAIADAIARCRAMTNEPGCGGYQISVQRHFALGIRCGVENILAAGATLEEARHAARVREDELRRDYHPEMGYCRQIVVVAPDGAVMAAMETVSSNVGG